MQTHYFLQKATSHIEAGDFDAAVHILMQILKNNADNTNAIKLMSIAKAQQGSYNAALDYINKYIQISPKNSVGHCIRGNILLALNLNDDAIESYMLAIKRDSLNAEAYNNLGNLYQNLAKHQEALECYKKAVQLQVKNHFFHVNLGNLSLKLKLFNEALNSFVSALSLDRRCYEAWIGKAFALIDLSRFDEALVAINEALMIHPSDSNTLVNKAVVLINLGRYQAALDLLDGINLSNPNISAVWSNRGTALEGLSRLQEAIESYEIASKLEPDFDDANSNLQNAKYSLACLNLRRFNFSDGWFGYESRWNSKGNSSTPISSSKPVWSGGAGNDPLYVWAEQGIGDQILYGSMLHDLTRLPQKKIITVNKKLVPIFQRSYPDFLVLEKGVKVPEEMYGEHIAMGSLGQFLRKEVECFKHGVSPYLMDSKDRTESINEYIASLGDKKVCGLSWRSSNSILGEAKSINLSELEPILKIFKLNFVSLQYGNVQDEIEEGCKNHDFRVHLVPGLDLYEDIDGLFSLIEACDIIVTTSNTTAHISGALGKETLLIVPYSTGRFWYWQDIDGKSLWYPSIRVFKQKELGDWTAPILAIKKYLEKRFEL